MKWSELPSEYRELDLGTDYDDDYDNLTMRFGFIKTKQGWDFWDKCHLATTIDELPPIHEKEFILPEKWCVKMKDPITDRNVYFHNPVLMGNHYFSGAMDGYGYTEITYEQWVKYVRGSEYKENALSKNDNLEKIKEMRDVVNDKDKEPIESFYMIYVDGASGSTRKHDYESACKEAQRLSKETDKKVFILRLVEYFERNIEIKNTILK